MSNQLVDLSTDGQIRADNDMAYAELGYKAGLGVEFCHGFNFQLELEAMARAGLGANIGEYVRATLDIEAGVEGGIQAAIQLSPDATQDIGLIAVVRAYIKAYIRARLELGLTLEAIVEQVRVRSSDIEFQIFRAFVEQIEVGIGVEANAQVGFTAIAELVCQGRLVEKDGEKPGFDFRTAAEAAFIYGTGTDFFAKMRFSDLDHFYQTSKNLLLDDLKQKAINKNPSKERAIDISFEVVKFAIDIVIAASSKTLVSKQNLCASLFLNEFKKQIVNEFLLAYEHALKEVLTEVERWINNKLDENDTDRDALEALIKSIKESVENAQDAEDLAGTLALLASLCEVLQVLKFPKIDTTIQLFMMVYCILYIASEEDEQAQFKDLNTLLKNEYIRVCGKSISAFKDKKDAFLYLEKGDFTQFVLSQAGDLGQFTKALLKVIHKSGHTLSYVLTLIFDKSDKTSFKSLSLIGFDVLEVLFEDYVVPAINNSVRPYLLVSDIGEDYYDIVFKDTMNGLPVVLIPVLRLLLSDEDYTPPDANKPLTKEQKAQRIERFVHLYLISFLAKNVNFVSQVLLERSAETAEDSCNKAIQALRSTSFDFMAHKMFDEIEDKVNALLPMPERIEYREDIKSEIILETKLFLQFIFTTAKFALGPTTWTESRINEIGDGIEALITNPTGYHFDFGEIQVGEDMNARMDQLMDCQFLSLQVKPELTAMLEVMSDIGLVQFKSFLFEMPKAAALYMLKLFYILFVGPLAEALMILWNAFKDRLKDAIDALKALADRLTQLAKDMVDVLDKVANKAKEYALALHNAVEDFFSNLKANINMSLLEWLEDIAQNIIDAITFWDDEDNETRLEAFLAELKKRALNNINDTSINTFVMNAAQDETPQASNIESFVETMIFDSSLRKELKRIKTNDNKTWSTRWTDNKSSSVSAREALITDADQIHIINLRTQNAQNGMREWERIKLTQEKRSLQLDTFFASNIKINAPLYIDAKNEQLPMHGEYVYIEIDFDRLDIASIIRTQAEINPQHVVEACQKGHDIGGVQYRLQDRDLMYNAPLLHVDVLLNGSALPLSEFKVEGNIASAHVDKRYLKQGLNQLVVGVTPPAVHLDKAVMKYVSFYSSKKYKRFPSNSVFINLDKSVINAPGNDHSRAHETNLDNKEKIVITNASSQDVNIGQWEISDAFGHSYQFVKNRVLRANTDYTLYVGNVPGRKYSWIAEYQGKKSAILNNAGEFIKLSDANGKVVSHVYTGRPRSNRHIHFLTKGEQS